MNKNRAKQTAKEVRNERWIGREKEEDRTWCVLTSKKEREKQAHQGNKKDGCIQTRSGSSCW